jgi:hypothetical protein
LIQDQVRALRPGTQEVADFTIIGA